MPYSKVLEIRSRHVPEGKIDPPGIGVLIGRVPSDDMINIGRRVIEDPPPRKPDPKTQISFREKNEKIFIKHSHGFKDASGDKHTRSFCGKYFSFFPVER